MNLDGDRSSSDHPSRAATHPPVVVAIHIAPASRLPVRSVDMVEVEAGAGLVGDRYHGTRHRHISIQSIDDVEAAGRELDRDIEPGATRRNVTISGGSVPTRPGTPIAIAGVRLEVVRLAAPCRLLDGWIGAGAMRAFHGRGGAICRALSSGPIRVGDTVIVGDRHEGARSAG